MGMKMLLIFAFIVVGITTKAQTTIQNKNLFDKRMSGSEYEISKNGLVVMSCKDQHDAAIKMIAIYDHVITNDDFIFVISIGLQKFIVFDRESQRWMLHPKSFKPQKINNKIISYCMR